ncbi:MAG: N-6 DNA methylase [Microbacterium enclense]
MQSFDGQMRRIHDHLYASANIRLPEDLQAEVAKVIQTLTWLAVIEDAPAHDPKTLGLALGGDQNAAALIANELRQAFTAYNGAMRRYPRQDGALKLDNLSLAFIAASLASIDMSDAARDWLGDALEVFRSTAAKRLGGQFFTDQRVTTLAMDLLQFDPIEDDLVDICAGTGGFLIAGARRAQLRGATEAPRLIGVEIDSSLAHLANSTIQHMANFPADAVFNADSFRPPSQWPLSLRKALVPGTHRKLATNPPFGQKITIKDSSILERYELGHVWSKGSENWTKSSRTSPTPPDILFLERNVDLAIPGEGRLAIVLPYQILSGPKLGYVREWILRNNRVVAVVDLPDDTFQPWTGTKTALLVLERRETPLPSWAQEDYPVFMAVSRQIGHDRRGNPILGEDGRVVCDLPDVAEAFEVFIDGGDPSTEYSEAFSVSSSRIDWASDLRLNAAYYEPTSSETIRLVQEVGEDADVEIATIGSVSKRIFFPGRFKRNYVAESDTSVPFLGGTNVTQLLPTNRKFVSSTDPRIEELRVEAGWILVTRSGSTGIVSSVPAAWNGYAMSEHVIRIEVDEEKIPAAYVEAYLRSEMGQGLLAQGIFGSVIDEITPEHIAALPLPVPKNKQTLIEIASIQAAANEHRNASILSFWNARSTFEERVGRQFIGLRKDADLSLSADDVVNKGQKLVEL